MNDPTESLASRFVSSALLLSLADSQGEKEAERAVARVKALTDQLSPGQELESFLSETAQLIRKAVHATPRETNGSFPNSIYRAFDGLDQLFGLHYGSDQTAVSISKERVYEGAGVGVQTSYATILRTFELIPEQKKAKWIDLGSGFGRVGLALGILRPDAEFIGYEIAPHRVDISNAAAKRAGLDSRIHFFAQDLSDATFEIPEADVYYMWDPFTKETYHQVLARLKALGESRAITVVAKGEAATWMEEIARDNPRWSIDRSQDGGNLGVFIAGGGDA